MFPARAARSRRIGGSFRISRANSLPSGPCGGRVSRHRPLCSRPASFSSRKLVASETRGVFCLRPPGCELRGTSARSVPAASDFPLLVTPGTQRRMLESPRRRTGPTMAGGWVQPRTRSTLWVTRGKLEGEQTLPLHAVERKRSHVFPVHAQMRICTNKNKLKTRKGIKTCFKEF